MMRFAWCACVVSAAAVAFGETVVTEVTDIPSSFAITPGGNVAQSEADKTTNVFESVFTTVDGVPPEVTSENVSFHFDANNRTGWEYSGETTQITKIPSDCGSRYLALTQDGGTKPSTTLMNNYTGPTFVAFDEDLGGPCVDFGALGSKHGLCFSPVEIDGNQCNTLTRIGTIVAVYGSQNSGGFLLGGGYGGYHVSFPGREWSRGNNNVLGNGNGTPVYASPMFDFRVSAGRSLTYHNASASYSQNTGFTGGWEVFSYQPTGADVLDANEANGIGICPYSTGYSSGMKIAEMYIFNCVIDRAVVARLEAYLRNKWFGKAFRGYDGDVAIGSVRQVQNEWATAHSPMRLDVPQGATMKIDRLAGGRQSGARAIKSGGGTLQLGDASRYGGTLVLEGGRLDLTRFSAPASTNELPSGLYADFDASAVDTLVTEDVGGTNLVRRWRSNVHSKFGGKDYVYLVRTDKHSPYLRTDALGEGLNVVDFGSYSHGGRDFEFYSGKFRDPRSMTFSYESAQDTFTAMTVQSVQTVVALIGAQRSGGHFAALGSASCYSRSDDAWLDDGSFATSLLTSTLSNGLNPQEEVKCYLNGVRTPPTKGYEGPGYQVVAFRGMGGGLYRLGGYTDVRSGGFRLGELLIFNRVLDEDEVRQASAYLEKKWTGVDTAYFRSAGSPAATVKRIRVDGPSEIYVAAGSTARIDALELSADVTKTGEGTLEVESSSGTGAIVVAAGKVVAVQPTDVSAKCEMAGSPDLQLDATVAKTLETNFDIAGQDTLRIWHDTKFRATAYQFTPANQPSISTDGETGKLPVIDFGATSSGKQMLFSRSFDAVRSAFAVWKPAGNTSRAGCFLGAAVTETDSTDKSENRMTHIDFMRGDTGSLFKNHINLLSGATIRTNGFAATCSTVPNLEFQVMEVHTAKPSHASALGVQQGGDTGGIKYGEILLYERELTPREQVATRNYLMKKWLGKSEDELEDLPPAEPTALGNLAFADGATLTVTRRDDGTVEPIANVSGTLSFGRNLTLNLVGFDPERDLGKKFVIAHAAEYAGLDDLKAATVTGLEIPAGCTLKFRATSGGDLVMKLAPDGTLLLVR